MATRLDGIVVAAVPGYGNGCAFAKASRPGFSLCGQFRKTMLARFVLTPPKKANAGKLCASARIIRLSGAKPWTGWLIFMAKFLRLCLVNHIPRNNLAGPMAWVPKTRFQKGIFWTRWTKGQGKKSQREHFV